MVMSDWVKAGRTCRQLATGDQSHNEPGDQECNELPSNLRSIVEHTDL